MLFWFRLLAVILPALIFFILYVSYIIIDTDSLIPLIFVLFCVLGFIFFIIGAHYLASDFVGDLYGYINSCLESLFESHGSVDTACSCCSCGCDSCR